MTAAEVLIESLIDWGVEFVFGLPGDGINGIMEALRTRQDKIRFVQVVKHFKWNAGERGKRRIHEKPRSLEIRACRPWPDAELRAIRPRVVVLLGATATQSLLGREFSVTRQRGRLVKAPFAPHVIATAHPSSILRAPDNESRRQQMQDFVRDLKAVAQIAKAEEAA